MLILSIETSCDETSAAIVEGDKNGVKILSNIVSSQIKIHRKYGGVVPEVAARNHIKNIIPVVDAALREAFVNQRIGKNFSEDRIRKAVKDIGLIAVTSGPGLISSLLIGIQTADMLSLAWNKPIIPINHIEGHIYANWLKPISAISNFQFSISKIEFPVLALVVSGGHTQMVLIQDHHKYKTIGQTRDDAAGEAFDKVAKILGIGYPGGPIISKLAKKGTDKYKLPRPMISNNDFDFSFSGLKTAVLYLVRDLKNGKTGKNNKFTRSLPPSQKEERIGEPRMQGRREGEKNGFPVKEEPLSNQVIADVCASFQQAVIEVMIHKTIRAAKMYKVKNILVAGGVSANWQLRDQMKRRVSQELGLPLFIPELQFCTDNAAMIGAAAYYRVKKDLNILKKEIKIKVNPNWEL